MALARPKPWHLPPERRVPDPGLKPRLDARGYPYYRAMRIEQKAPQQEDAIQPNYLGLEYLTVKGTWAPERRTLNRLIAEGFIDHQNEKLLDKLDARGIHLPADFASSADVQMAAFSEIGGGVCARALNVLAGNRKGDHGVVSRSGWHPLGFVIQDRRPDTSFIEAGVETPLQVDHEFLRSIEIDGIHRAVERRLGNMGIVLNGVPYGLRVGSKVDIRNQDRPSA